MAALAAGLPPAPVGFSEVQAGDPLSAMALTVQRAAEAPVLVGLPVVQADSAATAAKIPQAAAMYTSSDTALGQRLGSLPVDPTSPAAATGAAPGWAATAGGAGPMSAAARTATQDPAGLGGAPGGGLAAAAAADDGAAASLMSMPMQMASQAAGVPAQLAGALGSAPQGLAGIASSGMSQLTSAAGKAGESESGTPQPGTPQPGTPGAGAQQPEAQQAGGASGGDGERAPVDTSPPPADSRQRQS
jgi:hypothetical protein